MSLRKPQAKIDGIVARAYLMPTDFPESDGTLEWDSTTMVLARVSAGNMDGLGYSYTHSAAAGLINDRLAPLVKGTDAFDISGNWNRMIRAIRNLGRPGI